jgi:hypothetical protein
MALSPQDESNVTLKIIMALSTHATGIFLYPDIVVTN